MTIISITVYTSLLILLSKLFISGQSFFKIFFIFFLLLLFIYSFFRLFNFEIDVFIYFLFTVKILICYLLTIGLKSMSSPSEFIFEILKNNSNNFISSNLLVKEIENRNLIIKRIHDLELQKITLTNKNKIYLSNYGKIIFQFFTFLSKVSKIKIEG